MNIIITGASRGIGYELAFQLAADEAHQILVLSRNEEKLAQLCEHCQDAHGFSNISFIGMDLSQPDYAALDKALSDFGQVDVLVNNAGYLVNKPFEQLTMEDWQQQYEVNVLGPVRLIQYLLPRLEKSSRAHILNISSMGGVQGSAKFPGLSAYSSSKGALSILTECLAEEFKEKNIFVNCLAIGAVQTEMLEAAFPGYQAPLQPGEMAAYMAHFAQTGHHFYNGKILPVSLSTP